MADHFALMTGRLLTESTLQSAIQEAFADAVASTAAGYDRTDPSAVPEDVQPGMGVGKGKGKSGVMVECRICQEEGDEAYMETPCCCKGSLKYAHHRCVQRWCNEKGDTICEICLQQFEPNYTAPLFRHGRSLINSRGAGEVRENVGASHGQTSDQADGASSVDSQNLHLKGVVYCRVVAIALMILLVLRDAILLMLRDDEMCSVELITLLLFRTAGIVIPVYIILVSVTALLHWCNQRRIFRIQVVHETTVSEPRGAGGLQHIINIR
ncbi:protein binding protein isoform X1 [Zea mays]|uniref:Protein binding protein n=1 Tax=Zea mays TaxID=4577 RepID=B6T786_MAIZE|nr:protein binding protein [Zea mays]XP_008654974.1 protein binding protein isoform X1 [Zea mays]XP_020397730.1 protein binding protein isoform X1 [Zea mays]ACG32969.1 protein binding protein [Zea mays]ACN35677.1 unknown [Zea mays]|eukprot:NP_001148808.1 protein binding protein [Zea mays]